MEQSNMKPRGNGGPKMPRFNMTWLFTICLITMIILFFKQKAPSKYTSTRNIRAMYTICRQSL